MGFQVLVTFREGLVLPNRVPTAIVDADIWVVLLRISDGKNIPRPTKFIAHINVGMLCENPRPVVGARYFDSEMVQFFEAENVELLPNETLN